MRVQGIGHLVAAGDRVVNRQAAGIRLHQQGIEVEIVERGIAAADLGQQIGAANHFLKGSDAQFGQNLAHLLGDEGEQVHHLFRRAVEFGAQCFVLGTDPDRTGVGMALAHHDAAHGHQSGGAQAIFLGPQHRRDNHVAASFDAAIGAQHDAVPQAVEGEDLMDFRQAHFPRNADIFDA